MEVLFIGAILGIIPAMIASSKGRSFVLWWFYGAMIFIIAFPHSLIMRSNQKLIDEQKLKEGMKKCPYCAEMVKDEAIVCRYCGKDINMTSRLQEKEN